MQLSVFLRAKCTLNFYPYYYPPYISYEPNLPAYACITLRIYLYLHLVHFKTIFPIRGVMQLFFSCAFWCFLFHLSHTPNSHKKVAWNWRFLGISIHLLNKLFFHFISTEHHFYTFFLPPAIKRIFDIPSMI